MIHLATPTGFEPASIRRDSPVPYSLGQGAVSGDPHRIRTGVAALRVPRPYLPRRAGHVFCFVVLFYHRIFQRSWKIACELFTLSFQSGRRWLTSRVPRHFPWEVSCVSLCDCILSCSFLFIVEKNLRRNNIHKCFTAVSLEW